MPGDKKTGRQGDRVQPTPNHPASLSPPHPVIRASDLAQYKYCARAWWLSSVMGAPSANVRELQQGEMAHQAHGRKVWASSALVIAAAVLIVTALVILVLNAIAQ